MYGQTPNVLIVMVLTNKSSSVVCWEACSGSHNIIQVSKKFQLLHTPRSQREEQQRLRANWGSETGSWMSTIIMFGLPTTSKLCSCLSHRLETLNCWSSTSLSHKDSRWEMARLHVNSCQQVMMLSLPQPQTVVLVKEPNDKLGISIRGGGKGSKGNPLDRNDEGIFISKVNSRC